MTVRPKAITRMLCGGKSMGVHIQAQTGLTFELQQARWTGNGES